MAQMVEQQIVLQQPQVQILPSPQNKVNVCKCMLFVAYVLVKKKP